MPAPNPQRRRQTCQRSRPENTGIESSTAASSISSKLALSRESSSPGKMPKGGPFGWSQIKKKPASSPPGGSSAATRDPQSAHNLRGRAFVDQAIGCGGKAEKIVTNQVDRSRLGAPLCGCLVQHLARRFNRLRRKIERRDGPAQFGQMGGIPGAAAAGNQCVQRGRLAGDEAGKSRRGAAGIPGRDAFIEALAPEIRVLRALFGGLGRGGRRGGRQEVRRGWVHGFFRALLDCSMASSRWLE